MRSRNTTKLIVLIGVVVGITFIAGTVYLRSREGRILELSAGHLQQGELSAAREELERLLWFEPDHPQALHLMGLTYVQDGDWSSAISYLERIEPDSSVHESAHSSLAAALLADQQFERAAIELRAYVSRYPDSWLARRQLSGLLLTQLRRRDAVIVIEEALTRPVQVGRRPTDAAIAQHFEILRDLAVADVDPPVPARCLPVLTDALARHPDQPSVQFAIAECYWRSGEVARADQIFREFVNKRPAEPHDRFVLCEFLIDQHEPALALEVLLGRHEEGLDLPASLAEEMEGDDRFWELRCRISESHGEFEVSLDFINRALTIRPDETKYLTRKARLLQRLKRTDEASRAYARNHDLAEAEMGLWDLQRNLGTPLPKVEECNRMAELYIALGKPRRAMAWQRMAEYAAMQPPNESIP